MTFKEFLEKHQKVTVEEYPNEVPADPAVSVCVQTYQHYSYIGECLEAILMQKTDFPFEILVGDDDSSDGTRAICMEYADRYPDRIRLFLHHRENNIHLAGLPTSRFNSFNNYGHAQGKYIALCEGDDYWTDPYKLRNQIDFLESNKDYSVSFHPVVRHYDDPSIEDELFAPGTAVNGSEYTTEDLIIQGGSLIPTNSMMIRTDALNNFPEWAIYAPIGDLPLALVLSCRGRLHYTDEVMGAYRVNSTGSWSEKMREPRLQKLKYEGMYTMWCRFDDWTGGKFHQMVRKTKRQLTYRYYKFRVKKYGRMLYDSLAGK